MIEDNRNIVNAVSVGVHKREPGEVAELRWYSASELIR